MNKKLKLKLKLKKKEIIEINEHVICGPHMICHFSITSPIFPPLHFRLLQHHIKPKFCEGYLKPCVHFKKFTLDRTTNGVV